MQRAWAPLGVRARGAAKAAQPAQRAPRGARRGGWYRRARAAAAGVTPGTGAAQQVMQDGGRARARALGAGAPASELGRRCSCAGAGAGFRPGCEAMAAGGARRSGCCAQDCTAPATVMQREWPSTTTRRAPSSCARGPTRPGQREARVGGPGGTTAALALLQQCRQQLSVERRRRRSFPQTAKPTAANSRTPATGASLHLRICTSEGAHLYAVGDAAQDKVVHHVAGHPAQRPPFGPPGRRPARRRAQARQESSETGAAADTPPGLTQGHRPCADRWRPRERTQLQRWGARVG